MKEVTRKKTGADGSSGRRKVDRRLLLNYNIAHLLNSAVINEHGLPEHHCDPTVYPDYIALDNNKREYRRTAATAVAFYLYDRSFDHKDGLFNAIYYDDKRLLRKFEKRYEGIRFVIAPDFSIFDDVWRFENEYRLFKVRVIMLWFVNIIGAVVIPNAVYAASEKLPLYMSGLSDCTVMCFSTKGHVRTSRGRRRVRETVRYAVDNLPLKKIIVYSACGKDETSLSLFDYAVSKGVGVEIVDNHLRRKNHASVKGRC